MSLQPYQQRVVEERDELKAKIERLEKFIESDAWRGVPLDEKVRMRHQLNCMWRYLYALGDRIDAFVDSPAGVEPASTR